MRATLEPEKWFSISGFECFEKIPWSAFQAGSSSSIDFLISFLTSAFLMEIDHFDVGSQAWSASSGPVTSASIPSPTPDSSRGIVSRKVKRSIPDALPPFIERKEQNLICPHVWGDEQCWRAKHLDRHPA